MVIGALAVFSSIFTLGIKRFFLWEVFRPSKINARVMAGPFRLIPHPAYFGYLFVALGNALLNGELYLIIVFLFLLSLMPIIMRFEEEELRDRLNGA
jgi:protein-S-isoprenylcysteine O-methyltransferase Ste14